MMFITRVRLGASTCRAISLATHGSVFIRRCVAPHAGLHRPKRVLDRLAPHAHGLRVLVEAALHDFKPTLVFPVWPPDLTTFCNSRRPTRPPSPISGDLPCPVLRVDAGWPRMRQPSGPGPRPAARAGIDAQG